MLPALKLRINHYGNGAQNSFATIQSKKATRNKFLSSNKNNNVHESDRNRSSIKHPSVNVKNLQLVTHLSNPSENENISRNQALA